MKKLVLTLSLLVFIASSVAAQRLANQLPVPSPRGTVTQQVGVSKVTVDYGRPYANERVLFGGDDALQPNGQIWRAGANAATNLIVDTKFSFGGTELEAGTYTLYAIPGSGEWTFYLNSNPTVFAPNRDAALDVASVKVKPQNAEHQEQLLYTFDNVTNNGAHIVLRWGDLQVAVPIEVPTDALVEQKFNGFTNTTFTSFVDAATYHLNTSKDYEAGIQYADRALSIAEHMWPLWIKSQLLAAQEKYGAAIEVAERSLELAEEAGQQFFIDSNKDNIAKWLDLK